MSNKWGVILANLGTPEAPTPASVRAFLRDFLSDQRVVELPKFVWWPILYGVILPFRSKKVAKLYQEIWHERGSPLKVITEDQVEALTNLLAERYGQESPTVTYAMTYGEPSMVQRIEQLREKDVERILLLPLYPQYSATTTGALYDQYAQLIQSQRNIPDVVVHRQYFNREDYIQALAGSIATYWQTHRRSEKLLFSFHGIPKRCVDLGDPYFDQCHQTAEKVAAHLKLTADQWAVSFQSRLGKAEWLKPYTDILLEEWAQSGIDAIDVVCPAFSADCLETIEEIDGENRELFIEAGGKHYGFIPCLNDNPEHIQMMANIVAEYIGG